MFAFKIVLATVFVVASARHLPRDDYISNQGYDQYLNVLNEGRPIFEDEEVILDPVETYHPGHLARTRRQSTSVTLDSDGGIGLAGTVPLATGEKNRLSALGTLNLNNQMQPAATGLGLQLDNAAGHSLTVMKQNVPGIETSLTGAGKLNVFHNPNHNVDVRGSLTRHMPVVPNAPNFNTLGGGVDYMYKDRIGGSLGVASTPFQNRMDYSAMGNLNLFRNPTTSLDFSGGVRKMEVPNFSTGWQPNFGLTFSKYF